MPFRSRSIPSVADGADPGVTGGRLECKLLLAAKHDSGTLNSVIPTSTCPEYFRALGDSGADAAGSVEIAA